MSKDPQVSNLKTQIYDEKIFIKTSWLELFLVRFSVAERDVHGGTLK